MTRAAAGLTLLACMALVLAGCGGPSHGAFVKHADAVCAAYAAGASTLPKPSKYAQVAAYVDRNLPLYEAALRHNLPAVTAAAEEVRAAGLASSEAADTVGLTVCGR